MDDGDLAVRGREPMNTRLMHRYTAKKIKKLASKAPKILGNYS